MTPLFVFAADLHLQPCAWANRPEISGDAYESLKFIVHYCREHSLPLVLGGDVFDKKRPDPGTVGLAYQQLHGMEQDGLPVYYIQGNHDASSNVPWLACHTWPTHLQIASAEFGAFNCRGLDWQPSSLIKQALGELPPTDILVTHQAWEDFIPFKAEASFSDVRNVSLLLTGDYHVMKFVDGVTQQGQPLRVVSPGSTCMQAINEAPDKYAVVVQSDGDRLDAVPIRIPTRRLIRRDNLLDEETFNQFINSLPDMLEKMRDEVAALPDAIRVPLLHVKYADHIPAAYDRLCEAISNYRPHLFAAPVLGRVEEQEVQLPASGQLEWGQALAAMSPPPGVADAIRRLDQVDDMTTQLEQMRQEFKSAST